jgi:hypothetical protein
MLCPFKPFLFERSKTLNYEWTGEWYKFYTRIREVLGSNLGRDNGNTDLFCGFPQYLRGKYRESTSIKQRLFSSKSLSISHSHIIAPFGVIQSAPGGKVSIVGGHSIDHSRQENVYVHASYSERVPGWSWVSAQHTVHGTDEQHAMSSLELQSALMLMVEFSKMYYTR